jgi:pantothenate kinase
LKEITFLKGTPWVELQGIRDKTIFINPGIEIIKKRLIDRWFGYGLAMAWTVKMYNEKH